MVRDLISTATKINKKTGENIKIPHVLDTKITLCLGHNETKISSKV